MAGIYLHIPFCAKQCSYCDFHFSTSYAGYKTRMLEALKTELRARAADNNDEIATIYFGGGTPSLLSGTEVSELLETIRTNYQLKNSPEITLECNPDDCSETNLEAWKEAGVNRLSIGIQSFTDEQLSWMNRTHTANEGIEAVMRAKRTGFQALTVDLMYGLPDLSNEQWLFHLKEVIHLDVQHISAYCLTIEEQTPLAKWVKSGKIHPASADAQSVQFELLVEELAKAGYEQYEISNFARDEHYSRHNTAYWLGEQYIAIGPSAHGYNGKVRYWNIASNQAYMKAIEEGKLPETIEHLSPNDRFNELLLTGLRTKWGVSKNSLINTLSISDDWYRRIEHWKVGGKLIESETAYLLTQAGRLLADAITSDLFVL